MRNGQQVLIDPYNGSSANFMQMNSQFIIHSPISMVHNISSGRIGKLLEKYLEYKVVDFQFIITELSDINADLLSTNQNISTKYTRMFLEEQYRLP